MENKIPLDGTLRFGGMKSIENNEKREFCIFQHTTNSPSIIFDRFARKPFNRISQLPIFGNLQAYFNP